MTNPSNRVACPGPASPQTFHYGPHPDCPECGQKGNPVTTTDSQVGRLRRQLEELEHDQERFEEVVIEAWGAAGGGDVADLATLCDRLPYRVEQLLSRVRLLEAALREYEGLPWVEELPDSYHAFTDKVNKLLDADAPEEPPIVEAVCEALTHLDHLTNGNAPYNPDANAAASALRRAFGNL